MAQQKPLVAELTAQEEAAMAALEASIRNIHQLGTVNPEEAKRIARTINYIRREARAGLRTLLALNVGELDADDRRDYVVQFEAFTRTLAAANKVQPSRPM